MSYLDPKDPRRTNRGFASMDPQRQRELAAQGEHTYKVLYGERVLYEGTDKARAEQHYTTAENFACRGYARAALLKDGVVVVEYEV